MNCPSCKKTQPDNSQECMFCGLIFAKWQKKQERDSPIPQNPSESQSDPNHPNKVPKNVSHQPRSNPLSIILKGLVFALVTFGIIYAIAPVQYAVWVFLVCGFITIVEFLNVTIFWGEENTTKKFVSSSKPLFIAISILGVFYYPYIITPDFLAKEVSIGELKGNYKKYNHKKLKIRGWLSEQELSSFNIGSDDMQYLTLEDKEESIVVMCDYSDFSEKPKMWQEILLTGSVRSYGGGKPVYIANGLEIISREIKEVNLDEIYPLKLALENPEETQNLSIYEPTRLRKFPKEIFKLKNLKELTITSTQISEIPREISQLTKLERINFTNNKINSLPIEIGQLMNLEEISLSNNRLDSFPNEILNLVNLKYLYLSENKIKTIPDEISNLSNLKKINLSKNELTEIPYSLLNMNNLTEMGLSKNQITEIPEYLGSVGKLYKVRLDNNKISSLPSNFDEIKNRIRRLELKGNPLPEHEQIAIGSSSKKSYKTRKTLRSSRSRK